MLEKTKIGQNKKLVILLIVFGAVIVILVGVLITVLASGNKDSGPLEAVNDKVLGGKLTYDNSAVVFDQDTLQKEVDEMLEAVKDGYISVSHKGEAISSDGESFECYIANGEANKYDVYYNIYKDKTAREQLLLTGLIPPGSGITNFKSEIKLEPGRYEALLVITQVEEDHVTIHGGQLFLALDLVVQG